MFLTSRALIRGRVFLHAAQAEFFTMRKHFSPQLGRVVFHAERLAMSSAEWLSGKT